MEIIRKTAPVPGVFGRRGFLTGVGATLVYAASRRFALASVARRRSGSATTRSRSASRPAIRRPTASCCGRGWRRSRSKGGGMPQRPIAVQWRIATDERMWRIVERGAVLARARARPLGARRGRGARSRRAGTGISSRSATRSARSAARGRLRRSMPIERAAASRSSPASTTRTASTTRIEHMAEEDLDFVVHLGDYIYEGPATSASRPSAPAGPRDHVDRGLPDPLRAVQVRSRPAGGARGVPLDRHLGRSRDRKRLRGFIPENAADPADNLPDFASRRARAYQAYYEHMPLRAAQLPVGPYLQLYRPLAVRQTCCRSTCSTRGSIDRTGRRPTARSRSESTATARARSIRRGRSRARRSRRG